ncbi:MAG: pseudoazurin [Pseudomonadota bacterium]
MKILLVISTLFFSISIFATDHTVEMKNSGKNGIMIFEPAVLKVEVGDTVTFLPTDFAHNSESIAGLIPEGATPWKGELSQKVTVTIDKEGVYIYQCLPHAIMAMIGIIVAGKPTNLADIKAKSASLRDTFATNKERLDNYLAEIDQ